MKPFDETCPPHDCDQADYAGCVQFDYEGVFERLDGTPQPGTCPKALVAFQRLLSSLIPGGRPLRAAVGLRLIALAWVLNPANIAGSPSAAELARRCGVSRKQMVRLTAQMSRLAEWRNRAQRHAWNWQGEKGGGA